MLAEKANTKTKEREKIFHLFEELVVFLTTPESFVRFQLIDAL